LDWLVGRGKTVVDLHNAASSFKKNALKTGVRWNDMPTGNANDYLNPLLFAYDFKNSKDPNTLVRNSHYGCLQHVHGMAPVFSPRTGVPATATGRVLFSNLDVLNIMKAQGRFWWDKAVSVAHTHTKPDVKTASHYLGHFAHMLQDSYAPGHALRGYVLTWGTTKVAEGHPQSKDEKSVDQLGGSCGHVISFQGYGAQMGNSEHGSTDHDPTDVVKGRFRSDKDVRERLIYCARGATYALFVQFHKCLKDLGHAPCSFDEVVKTVFDVHFVLSRPNELAGGANAYMAGKTLVAAHKKLGAKSPWALVPTVFVTVTDRQVQAADESVYIPNLLPGDVLWSANAQYPNAPVVSAGTPLCTEMTARVGFKTDLTAEKKQFLDFANPDNTGADANVALRNARTPVPDATKFQI